jgi:hypothetical protein
MVSRNVLLHSAKRPSPHHMMRTSKRERTRLPRIPDSDTSNASCAFGLQLDRQAPKEEHRRNERKGLVEVPSGTGGRENCSELSRCGVSGTPYRSVSARQRGLGLHGPCYEPASNAVFVVLSSSENILHPIIAMSRRHMTIARITLIECCHAKPADVNSTPPTLHMITSIGLLNDRLTIWAVSRIVIFLPLLESHVLL